jgi:hypothetical protein
MDAAKYRFYGRERLLREIVQGVLAPQPASFSLVGSKLLGKTQILNHLAAPAGPLLDSDTADWRPPRFQDPGRIIVCKIDCDWSEAQEDLLGFTFQRLSRQVQHQERIGLNWPEIEAEEAIGRRLWRMTQQLNEMDYRLVVLFDNFDSVFQRQLLSLDAVDELRPLTMALAMVVATEQPLHDLDRELAASPLFNVMTQLFVGLLETDAACSWLDAYASYFSPIAEMRDDLLEVTGSHPYLLHRIGDILPEVQQMLPDESAADAEELFPLIRLRLAEHGRLLFTTLWRKLQQPPRRVPAEAVLALMARLLEGPLPTKAVSREHFAILNWLINQAMVTYTAAGYQLFSPLFAEFLAARITQSAPAVQVAPPPPSHLESSGIYERLTKTEAALLRYFEKHSDQVIPAQQLLEDVWKRPDASTRRVQEAIRRLRIQLEEEPTPLGVIENERGRGYRFVPATQSGA